MAVKDGNLNALIPGLPAKDVNSDYDTFNTPGNAATQNDTDNVVFRVSAETNGIQTGAAAGGPKGEGDEMSVLRVLWDVYDSNADAYGVGSDRANWGATATLGLMRMRRPSRTFGITWLHRGLPIRPNLAWRRRLPSTKSWEVWVRHFRSTTSQAFRSRRGPSSRVRCCSSTKGMGTDPTSFAW